MEDILSAPEVPKEVLIDMQEAENRVINELCSGSLCVMDESGDTRIQWDANNTAEVAKAKAKFDELKAKGYMAYKVNKKGTQGEVLQAFDPNAERIILHSQMIGG